MSRKLALLLSTWFYVGFFPIAPGTAGSIVAVLIAAFLHHYLGFAPWMFAVMAVLLFPIAVRASTITAKANNLDDPGFVVIDEVIGQWITLAGASQFNWKTALAGLVLFRLFDIWKPPPVRQLERLHGGLGINADDAMAGVYGAIVLAFGCWLLAVGS
jgi:phosphatidylglycerophosphatase A